MNKGSFSVLLKWPYFYLEETSYLCDLLILIFSYHSIKLQSYIIFAHGMYRWQLHLAYNAMHSTWPFILSVMNVATMYYSTAFCFTYYKKKKVISYTLLHKYSISIIYSDLLCSIVYYQCHFHVLVVGAIWPWNRMNQLCWSSVECWEEFWVG